MSWVTAARTRYWTSCTLIWTLILTISPTRTPKPCSPEQQSDDRKQPSLCAIATSRRNTPHATMRWRSRRRGFESNPRGTRSRSTVCSPLHTRTLPAVHDQRGEFSPSSSRNRKPNATSNKRHARQSTSRTWKLNLRRLLATSLLPRT